MPGLRTWYLIETIFVDALHSISSVQVSGRHELKAKRGPVTPCCGILVCGMSLGKLFSFLHTAKCPCRMGRASDEAGARK